MLTLKEMVSDGKKVRFSHYRDDVLHYITEDGFTFQVPIADTGAATFPAEDKAILFMRWIRREIDLRKTWVEPTCSPMTGPEGLKLAMQSKYNTEK